MIMIQQLIQYMVHQINIDLVYDIQFETNITKMDEREAYYQTVCQRSLRTM